MPFLLDTCAFLWLNDRKKISPRAQETIEGHSDDLFVSAISAFEIGIKTVKKKLNLSLPPEEWFRQMIAFFGVNYVPFNYQIASQTAMLPPLHADPCDRFLIATAREYNMQILTPDRLISQYPEAKCLW